MTELEIIVAGVLALPIVVYAVVRIASIAYFKSKREHTASLLKRLEQERNGA